MQFANPYDHSFNETRRFTDRKTAPYVVNNTTNTNLMPAIKNHLPKVSPINNDEEDEFITVLKDLITHERELEEAKIRLSMCTDFNLMDGFQMLDFKKRGWLTAPDLHDVLMEFG
jgi:hypothetical protein